MRNQGILHARFPVEGRLSTRGSEMDFSKSSLNVIYYGKSLYLIADIDAFLSNIIEGFLGLNTIR